MVCAAFFFASEGAVSPPLVAMATPSAPRLQKAASSEREREEERRNSAAGYQGKRVEIPERVRKEKIREHRRGKLGEGED